MWLLPVAVGAVIAGGLWARPPVVTVVRVQRADLEQHVVASGRVMAPAEIAVAALASGRVTAVPFDEGQQVAAGALLVQLDEAEARVRVAEAEAASEAARARLREVGDVSWVVTGSEVDQARALRDDAARDLSRARRLVEAGAAPRMDVEDAGRALEVAEAQLRAASARQGGASVGGADAQAARAAVAQADAQVALALVQLDQTRVLAPQDGLILTRSVEPGAVVSPGAELMTLAPHGPARIALDLDERQLVNVALGRVARASADAFPDDRFSAEVVYVAPSVDAERGTVEVRLQVPQPPPYLRPEMTVSVDLTVATVQDALVVPAEAVGGLATPQPWVLAVIDDRAERRVVRIGVRGEGSVEVSSGLVEGEAVLLERQGVEPGQRVRARLEEP